MITERLSGNSTGASYDARYYEGLHGNHWFRNNAAKRERRWRAILDMLEPAPEDRLLEIGCASGVNTLRLAAHAGSIVGIDLAAAGIERATKNAAAAGVTNATFLQADAAALGTFAAASFDKVAAIDFFEHVDDDTLALILAEVRRVLIPGGRLAFYTPCATHYVERLKAHNLILRQDPGHIAVRGPAAYRTLLAKAGFAVASLRFLPSDYPVAGWIDRAMLRLPRIDSAFRFRICIVAQPLTS